MDKKLISLNELQLYVKSRGNSKNERVKTFLNNVFEIGFSLKYIDIFPMDDFEYGDLLVLDYEFLYKEYLKFLEKKETYDDILFYIAENEYANFYELISYDLKDLKNFTSLFKTRKQLLEARKQLLEENPFEEKKQTSSDKIIDLEDIPEAKKDEEDNQDELSNLHINEKRPIYMESALIDGLMGSSPYIPPERLEEKVLKHFGININFFMNSNIYARIRIEEHLKNIKQIRKDVGSIFS